MVMPFAGNFFTSHITLPYYGCDGKDKESGGNLLFGLLDMETYVSLKALQHGLTNRFYPRP